jgi:hypothetical protein
MERLNITPGANMYPQHDTMALQQDHRGKADITAPANKIAE